MEIWPAIDLLDGQAVRLTKGDYEQVKVYFKDPAEILRFFEEAGAKHLHVVDLDGARKGTCENFETIERLCRESSMEIEVGGGIRDLERIEKYLELGVSRVILGTAAVEDPELLRSAVKRYGRSIVVGVDARDGKVAIRGWEDVQPLDALEFCQECAHAGVSHIIYTDIAKDGMLSGTNIPLYKTLHDEVPCSITASGGVTDISELVKLKEIGTEAVIIGKALYEGRMDLKEALAIGDE